MDREVLIQFLDWLETEGNFDITWAFQKDTDEPDINVIQQRIVEDFMKQYFLREDVTATGWGLTKFTAAQDANSKIAADMTRKGLTPTGVSKQGQYVQQKQGGKDGWQVTITREGSKRVSDMDVREELVAYTEWLYFKFDLGDWLQDDDDPSGEVALVEKYIEEHPDVVHKITKIEWFEAEGSGSTRLIAADRAGSALLVKARAAGYKAVRDTKITNRQESNGQWTVTARGRGVK